MVRLIQSQAFLLWVGHLVLRLFFFWLYPLPPRDLSQESSFCPFFSLGNQCFIDPSVLFHPAAHQCFIDLSLIWISNWCRLEWQSFHIQEKQQPGLFLRTSENESLHRPCKSASTQIISSPENSDYFSFAETSRENFAFLARIKLSTISRLSAQCWSILLHSTDKNWSSQKHIDTKLCSQNPFYKICTECQRPGFKREDRSANVKAPAIQCIWAMKWNIWTRPSKRLKTCLFNMLN